jgi:hypothetical protein
MFVKRDRADTEPAVSQAKDPIAGDGNPENLNG